MYVTQYSVHTSVDGSTWAAVDPLITPLRPLTQVTAATCRNGTILADSSGIVSVVNADGYHKGFTECIEDGVVGGSLWGSSFLWSGSAPSSAEGAVQR